MLFRTAIMGAFVSAVVCLAQYGLKDDAGAEATLRQVVQRYPGSDVARTADDRLRAMQISGAR